MRITALVENQSSCDLTAKHGLSLYIETDNHKILFDLGPGHTLFDNSAKRGIDLANVDTVIISHGHVDHGGALEQFLKINHTAKIFVQKKAFEKHYTKFLFLKVNVGLDSRFQNHPQIVLVEGDYRVDNELRLFTVADRRKHYSPMNDVLYTDSGKDDFAHEQNLMILGSVNVLIMGCGHTGVANILEKAVNYNPNVCIGGYHLQNPLTRKTVSDKLLENIAQELSSYDIQFYTCHCTGQKAYRYLSQRLDNMHYLSCGDMLEL